MAACSTTDSDTDEERGDIILDLTTLTAETEFGTLHAQRAENSFVGPLDMGQSIGVAFLEDVGGTPDSEEQVVVYLYDRFDLAMMIGKPDEGGTAVLQSLPGSDFEASISLVMEDDLVSGTASFPGQQAVPFTADLATGVGGIYWAIGTDEEADISADWVVLPDERQWGCVCVPPGINNPCCHMRF